MGVNSLPKTVTRQRRGCDLNPGRSAPESSTLTVRLPSHLFLHVYDTYTIFRMTLTMWTIVTACCRCFKSNACRCPPKLPLSVAEIRPYPIQCGPTCRGGATVLNVGNKTWFASEASGKKMCTPTFGKVGEYNFLHVGGTSKEISIIVEYTEICCLVVALIHIS